MVRLSLIAKFVACGITDADDDPERPAIKDVRLAIKQVSLALSRAHSLSHSLASSRVRSLSLSPLCTHSLSCSSLPLTLSRALSLSRSDTGRRRQMLYHDNEVHAKGRILIMVPRASRLPPVCAIDSRRRPCST